MRSHADVALNSGAGADRAIAAQIPRERDAAAERLEGVKLQVVTERTEARDVGVPFADLYRAQYGAMVRLAHLLTGSNGVAEELVQDAFVRIHGKWDQIDAPGAYLRTTVVNACRSHHRRRVLERARRPEMVVEATSPVHDELWDALARLSYRQRAVLVLKFYEDMAERDIAAALGCRPGTVKSLTSRALDELRKVIER